MSATAEDEDSEPGFKPGTPEYRAVMRDRLRKKVEDHGERIDDVAEKVGAMRDEISSVKKVQIAQGTKLEVVIEFHQELKKYARIAITGLFGLVALEVVKLVLKKGSP